MRLVSIFNIYHLSMFLLVVSSPVVSFEREDAVKYLYADCQPLMPSGMAFYERRVLPIVSLPEEMFEVQV